MTKNDHASTIDEVATDTETITVDRQHGEQTMTIVEFARRHMNDYGAPLMGAFLYTLEQHDRSFGKETDLIRELARFAN